MGNIPDSVRIRISAVSGSPEECWPWPAAKTKAGYGQVWDAENKKVLYTHRIAWELANGPIPDGKHICHHCDTPPCINPAHLFVGTAQDNADDKIAKGRHRWGGGKRFSKGTNSLEGKVSRGETHARAILTNAEVQEIKRRLAGGERGINIQLAQEFGVSPPTISAIKKGRNWA